jgi:hypothetical protein
VTHLGRPARGRGRADERQSALTAGDRGRSARAPCGTDLRRRTAGGRRAGGQGVALRCGAGGTFDLGSAPGGGAAVRLTLPLVSGAAGPERGAGDTPANRRR